MDRQIHAKRVQPFSPTFTFTYIPGCVPKATPAEGHKTNQLNPLAPARSPSNTITHEDRPYRATQHNTLTQYVHLTHAPPG